MHILAAIEHPRSIGGLFFVRRVKEISGLTVNYNAVLGHGNFVGQAAVLVDAAIADYRAICSEPSVNIMITGYSSGGLTALCAARAVNGLPDAKLLYIGLADAAIDTTDPVQVSFGQCPSVTASYLKNYYQTLGNQDSNPLLTPKMTPPEWHGVFQGFVSICLDGDSTVIAASKAKDDDPHEHACRIGLSRIKDDLRWCDNQYGEPIY